MEVLSIDKFSLSIDNEPRIINGSFKISSGDVVLLTGPNGSGKSTVIKALMGALFDYDNLEFSCDNAKYNNKYDILHNEKDNEIFRKNVCYVSQEDEFESENVLDCFINSISYTVKKNKEKYVFDFIMRYSIQECFGKLLKTDSLSRIGKKIIRSLKLKEKQLSDAEKKAIAYLSTSTKRMSGGQRKLTNIFSNLIRYEFCDLIILDEPLNNLDYNNVRSFSNVLAQIYKTKSNLAMLIVTHCRSIPIINRVISIDSVKKGFVEENSYICSSCFGKIGNDGLYY